MATGAIQRFKTNPDFPISAIAPVVIAGQTGMMNNALGQPGRRRALL
jgi:hypothetical protein